MNEKTAIMEYFVKPEPLDFQESPKECILCDDGKKYYNLLIQHFKIKHKGKKKNLLYSAFMN